MNQRIISYTSALLLLLLIPLTWQNVQPRAQLLALGMVAVGGGAWLIARLRSSQPVATPRLALPFALFVAWQAMLIKAAPLPAYSLHSVVASLLALLGFLFMVDATRGEGEKASWELIFLLIGFILICLDLAYMLDWYRRWTEISGELFSPPPFSLRAPGLLLGHPNFFAAYLNLFAPLVLVRLAQAHKAQRLPWLIFLAALLMMLFFTSSRSAWLASAISLGVTTGFLFIPSWLRGRDQGISRKLEKRHFFVIGAALALILIFWPILRRQVQSAAHGTIAERATIWAYGLEQISASPIWGNGPGSTPFLFALRSEEVSGDEVYHGHNIWLQISMTTGLVGLAIVIWMAVEIIKTFARTWRNTLAGSPGRASLAAYAGVGAGLAVHSLLDYVFDPLIFSMGVMFILACTYHDAPGQAFFTAGRRWSALAAGALILACLGGMLIWTAGAAQFWEGWTDAWRGERQAAQESICRAAQANPGKTYYGFQCSLAMANLAFETNDLQVLQAATELHKSTLERDPYWYLHWVNLASYEWQLGNHEEAVSQMRKATEMAPRVAWTWLNLGWMEEQLGRADPAAIHYRKAVCLSPWYRESPLFEGTGLRRQALQADCSAGGNTLSSAPVGGYSWSGWSALKSGEVETAVQAFERAIQADPRDPLPYALLGLAHQQAGENEQAWKDIRTAIFISSPSARVYFAAAQVAYSQGKEGQAAEYLSTAYDLLTHPQTSQRYYLAAYHQVNPPSDTSPYTVRTGLPPELRALLLKWVERLQGQGQADKAHEVLLWMERNSSQ